MPIYTREQGETPLTKSAPPLPDDILPPPQPARPATSTSPQESPVRNIRVTGSRAAAWRGLDGGYCLGDAPACPRPPSFSAGAPVRQLVAYIPTPQSPDSSSLVPALLRKVPYEQDPPPLVMTPPKTRTTQGPAVQSKALTVHTRLSAAAKPPAPLPAHSTQAAKAQITHTQPSPAAGPPSSALLPPQQCPPPLAPPTSPTVHASHAPPTQIVGAMHGPSAAHLPSSLPMTMPSEAPTQPQLLPTLSILLPPSTQAPPSPLRAPPQPTSLLPPPAFTEAPPTHPRAPPQPNPISPHPPLICPSSHSPSQPGAPGIPLSRSPPFALALPSELRQLGQQKPCFLPTAVSTLNNSGTPLSTDTLGLEPTQAPAPAAHLRSLHTHEADVRVQHTQAPQTQPPKQQDPCYQALMVHELCNSDQRGLQSMTQIERRQQQQPQQQQQGEEKVQMPLLVDEGTEAHNTSCATFKCYSPRWEPDAAPPLPHQGGRTGRDAEDRRDLASVSDLLMPLLVQCRKDPQAVAAHTAAQPVVFAHSTNSPAAPPLAAGGIS